MHNSHLPIFSEKESRLARRRTCRIGLMLAATLLAGSGAAETVTGIRRLPDARDARPNEDSIYFAQGSALIDAVALRTIQRHITRLAASPGLYATIVAHSDDLGSVSMEVARGQARLDAVRQLIEEAKIQPTRLRAINLGGESDSVSACADEDCRRLRRRVDFLFHG
jgi:outer membrane protein OmpA-like peptidoglycan-associated protein